MAVKTKHVLQIVFMILMLSLGASSTNAQEGLLLPADLVFTVEIDNKPTLMIFDHLTLDAKPFYTEPGLLDVNAAQWSPSGTNLAIVRLHEAASPTSSERIRTICIISREGEMIGCMEDRPPSQKTDLWTDHSEIVNVTWSPDESKIYFVRENGTLRELVEADVESGVTLTILYSVEYIPNVIDDQPIWYPPILSWTTDLTYLLIGVTSTEQDEYRLVDLQTDVVIPFSSAFTTESEHLALSYICNGFSPDNDYFMAFGANNDTQSVPLFILNTSGEIVDELVIENSINRSYPPCPIWGLDNETIVYFSAPFPTATQLWDILAYNLVDRNHQSLYSGWNLPLGAISPDGTTILLRHPDPGQLAFLRDSQIFIINLPQDRLTIDSEILWRPISN